MSVINFIEHKYFRLLNHVCEQGGVCLGRPSAEWIKEWIPLMEVSSNGPGVQTDGQSGVLTMSEVSRSHGVRMFVALMPEDGGRPSDWI